MAELVRLLRDRFPAAVVDVDAPSRPDADWFVDVKVDGRSFVVELRPALGFGLSSIPVSGFGEGPDELLTDESAVVERVAVLLAKRSRTKPQRARLLRELRARRHVSQSGLAKRLGVRQPTVSKMERREELNLATIRRYVEALGGELRVVARFVDDVVEIAIGVGAKDGGARRRR